MPTPRPAAALLGLALLAGCPRHAPPPRTRNLPENAVAKLVRSDVKDRAGWGEAVHAALLGAGQPVTVDTACQVLAVIEQESGYAADPAVPNLGTVVKGEVDAVFARLGPAAGPIRKALLDQTAPGQSRTFEARLGRVQTEQQADRLYREIVAFHLDRHPHVARAMDLLAPDFVEAHNPITTAGSMQVSVAWAVAREADQGLEAEEVRERLYTRMGGVAYGTARLFAHEAPYTDPRHRFADFNAGLWASRNAALQEQLSDLTGRKLALDGDFLRYDADGEPSRQVSNTVRALLAFRARYAPDLSERRVRRDAALEKTAAFDDTETVQRLRAAWEAQHGKAPPYARVPDVALHSPKMKSGRSTEWFADNVRRRYDACVARGG